MDIANDIFRESTAVQAFLSPKDQNVLRNSYNQGANSYKMKPKVQGRDPGRHRSELYTAFTSATTPQGNPGFATLKQLSSNQPNVKPLYLKKELQKKPRQINNIGGGISMLGQAYS